MCQVLPWRTLVPAALAPYDKITWVTNMYVMNVCGVRTYACMYVLVRIQKLNVSKWTRLSFPRQPASQSVDQSINFPTFQLSGFRVFCPPATPPHDSTVQLQSFASSRRAKTVMLPTVRLRKCINAKGVRSGWCTYAVRYFYVQVDVHVQVGVHDVHVAYRCCTCRRACIGRRTCAVHVVVHVLYASPCRPRCGHIL